MKSTKLLTIFFLTAILFINISCSSEEPVKKRSNAPDLPPKASLIMDYNSFSNSKDSATNSNNIIEATTITNGKKYANFGYATLNVLFWNGVLTVNLAVPAAAFSEAFKQNPKYLGNSEWIWSYQVTVKNQKYKANLHAKLIGKTDIEWKMYLSKEGEYKDFLWYEGTMNRNYQQIEWIIYQSPNNPTHFLTVNYQNDKASGKQSIRYTKAEETTGTEASYIEHGNLTNADMNRYYTIYLQDKDKLTEIEWHYTNGNGHVRDKVHFKDTKWHCWNERHKDIECN